MTTAYIALGSNLDDPDNQLRRAVIALQGLPTCHLEKVSSVYRSTAVGPGDQPDYLNAVVCLQTALSPLALLNTLQGIENAQGRVRDVRWGPRSLDLDLLLYGDRTIMTPRLTVPHPRLHERHFVLYPLREIAGENLLLPDGTRLKALLKQCSEEGLVKTQFALAASTSVYCESH